MGIKLNYSDFIGKRYGYLIFVRDIPKERYERKSVEVKCDCGKISVVDWDNLRSGKTKSCGCKQHKEKWEGSDPHPLRKIWTGIKQRCYNEKCEAYRYYGAKGVTMCDEWKNNYRSFYYWCINNGWQSGLEIDKDIIGDGLLYSPETCIIVTHLENTSAFIGTLRISKEAIEAIKNSNLSSRKLSKIINVSRNTINKIRNKNE